MAMYISMNKLCSEVLIKKYKKNSTDCKIYVQNIYVKENISSR